MLSVLLVASGVFLASLFSYSVATALVVHLVVRLIRLGYAGKGVWRNVLIIMIICALTALVHLTQIALWALIILWCGEVSTLERAIYWSAQNYTALGYGDVIVSERWRLLGPLEAINGILLFGLSTALVFTVVSRLVAIRLHLRPDEDR